MGLLLAQSKEFLIYFIFFSLWVTAWNDSLLHSFFQVFDYVHLFFRLIAYPEINLMSQSVT